MKLKYNMLFAALLVPAASAANFDVFGVRNNPGDYGISSPIYTPTNHVKAHFATGNGGLDGGLGTNIYVVHDDANLDGDGNAQTVTWTSNNSYFVRDKLFIPKGTTLTIQPGTKVYFSTDNNGTSGSSQKGDDAVGAITACRGGKLIASGTAAAPIVFTTDREFEISSGLDSPIDSDLTVNSTPLTPADAGLWGGIILLGQAYCSFVNSAGANSGTVQIEGFAPAGSPNGDGDSGGIPDATQYGTSANYPRKDDDNSGIVRYCSIRHGGYEFSSGREINGLTMGCVGSGTTIEFVEVYANLDDGFEFFGGRVNTRNLVCAFVQDDMFDIDEGYRGTNQFWFGIQNSGAADAGGEWDGVGGDSAGYGTLFTTTTGDPHHAKPIIYNATFIGAGNNNTLTQLPNTNGGVNWEKGNHAFHIEDNFDGEIYDSVFDDFAADLVKYNDGLGAATAYHSRGSNGLSPKFINNTIGRFGSAVLQQIETITVGLAFGTTTTSALGSISVGWAGTGLSAGTTTNPFTVSYAAGETASDIATKIQTALNGITGLTGLYTVNRISGVVSLTSIASGASAQDSTLQFSWSAGTGGVSAHSNTAGNAQAATNSSVTTGGAAADFLTNISNINNGPVVFTAAALSGGTYATYPHIMTIAGAMVGGNSNPNTNPQLTTYTRDGNNKLTAINPIPAPGSPLLTSSVTGAGPKKVSYRGAFGPDGNWAAGWTKLSQTGVLTGTAPAAEIVDIDGDGIDDVLEATTALTNLGFSAGVNNVTPTNLFSSLYTATTIQDLRGTGMMIGPVSGPTATVTLPLFSNTTLNPNTWTAAGNVTGTVNTTPGKSFFRVDLSTNAPNP